jgi:hypothetical protein
MSDDFSEPEPDIALVRPPDERYVANHPRPEDVFLILEIADSSLPYDRDVKCPLFARNGILQLQTRELEDYREPSAEGYRSKKTYAEDESFNLVAFPKLSIKSVGSLNGGAACGMMARRCPCQPMPHKKRYVCGFTQARYFLAESAARSLGLPEGTVKARLSRGREMLRSKLESL